MREFSQKLKDFKYNLKTSLTSVIGYLSLLEEKEMNVIQEIEPGLAIAKQIVELHDGTIKAFCVDGGDGV